MGALIVQDEALEVISDVLHRHEQLMAYARKHPPDHPFWDTVPADIKTGALNWCSRVEELYADEVDDLRGENGDWAHGFNSGVVSGLRLALRASVDP